VGSRSKARARAQVSEAPEPEVPPRPRSLTWAALIQGIEAVGVLFASVLAGVDAMSGRSYHANSGIALTLIGVVTAVALGYAALGIARARRWSRTPAVLTQLFCGIVSIYLLQAHRFEWGVPGMVLVAAGFTALFVPASFRALAREPLAPPTGRKG
jgi:hypothetical protein